MKQIISKYLYKVLILGYGLFLGIFILKALVTAIISYSPKSESAIPQFAISKLNKVYDLVIKREKLPNYTETDLSKFRFGKFEPFE
ncbi:MAG: hypothetical protein ABIJ05_02680 [Patescibacteria group bacterium]